MMNLPTFKKEPELIRATFRINTPMFIAGANQKDAEFTPTAFKGVLRFWWRALNWSKIFLAKKDKTLALKALHEQEAELFGVASSDIRVRDGFHNGQGAVSVNYFSEMKTISDNALLSKLLTTRKEQFNKKRQEKEIVYEISSGLGYLFGQGLFDRKKGIVRSAIDDNQTFTIDLTVVPCRESGDNKRNFQDEILDVLKLIGLLGSFGSRSRHGFGSVTLTDLQTKKLSDDNYQAISLNQNAQQAIQDLLSKHNCRKNTELPPLSAFYSGTRIDVISFAQNNAVDILNNIGEEQQLYRSWGRNGKVNGNKDAKKNFAGDHDFVLNLLDNKPNPIMHPKRVVFGLPHNYFYSGNQTRGYSGNIDASTGRRASPLLLHIHRTNNGYQAIHCLFKSEFLPNGATVDIVAKQNKDKKIQKVSAQADYQVIETFMNRFNGERV